jgi:hypothetical protein
MNFDEYLSEKIFIQRKENLEEVYKQIKTLTFNKLDKNLKQKIQNKHKSYSFLLNFDEYYKKLQSDILFCVGLEKDPLKQNISEKLQIEYFNKKNKSEKIYKPPKHLYLDIENCKSKSFDGIIKNKKAEILGYCYLKYIKDAGGAQDNQVKDIETFISECINCIDKYKNKEKFYIIVDGQYGKSKINKLMKLLETDKLKDNKNRIKILSSDNNI